MRTSRKSLRDVAGSSFDLSMIFIATCVLVCREWLGVYPWVVLVESATQMQKSIVHAVQGSSSDMPLAIMQSCNMQRIQANIHRGSSQQARRALRHYSDS